MDRERIQQWTGKAIQLEEDMDDEFTACLSCVAHLRHQHTWKDHEISIIKAWVCCTVAAALIDCKEHKNIRDQEKPDSNVLGILRLSSTYKIHWIAGALSNVPFHECLLNYPVIWGQDEFYFSMVCHILYCFVSSDYGLLLNSSKIAIGPNSGSPHLRCGRSGAVSSERKVPEMILAAQGRCKVRPLKLPRQLTQVLFPPGLCQQRVFSSPSVQRDSWIKFQWHCD